MDAYSNASRVPISSFAAAKRPRREKSSWRWTKNNTGERKKSARAPEQLAT